MANSRWSEITLGDLVDNGKAMIQTGPFGSQLHSYDYASVGIPVVPTEAIGWRRINGEGVPRISLEKANELSRHRLKEGDILFARRGIQATGLSAIVERQHTDWICGTGAILLRLQTNEVDPVFLSFFLIDEITRQWLRTNAVGAVMPNLNEGMLKRLPVRLPPRKEQERIANILGTLDDKIELNRRMNETLEAMVRRLFRSWFVDFDPVHAKAALRKQHPKLSNAELSRRALPSLAAEIAELFPDGFEESTLGPIPKGWTISQIDQVATINNWTLGKNDELPLIDYIEISEVMRGEISEIKRFQRGQEPSRARRRLRHGDFVLSTVRPDRGAYFLCLHPAASLLASTGFAVVTPGSVPWSWTAAALSAHEVFEYLGHHADGGAYPAVNPSLIGRLKYPIPVEQSLLYAFHSATAPMLEKAHANRTESQDIQKIRDALLPKLLAGELASSRCVRKDQA